MKRNTKVKFVFLSMTFIFVFLILLFLNRFNIIGRSNKIFVVNETGNFEALREKEANLSLSQNLDIDPKEEANISSGEDAQKNMPPSQSKSEENNPEMRADKKSVPSLFIIAKPVSWGYRQAIGRKVDTIIIHSSYNALSGDPYDLEELIKEYKLYGVSSHYLIDRRGRVYGLVDEKNIAYHAGVSRTPDKRENVNDYSIGIEIMNTEKDKPTEEQYEALRKLINEIKSRYKIKYILGHNQISPGRKTDPWNFDWEKI